MTDVQLVDGKLRAVNPIMKYFQYAHLPPFLQELSKPFCEMAQKLNADLPDCAEKSAGLRKLLEAKDCFVRAALEIPAAAATPPQSEAQARTDFVGPPKPAKLVKEHDVTDDNRPAETFLPDGT